MSFHAFKKFSLESPCYLNYAKKQLNSYNNLYIDKDLSQSLIAIDSYFILKIDSELATVMATPRGGDDYVKKGYTPESF